MNNTPTIKTDRLILRKFTEEDIIKRVSENQEKEREGYRKAKFKRRILHPERVLLEWSDFVYLGGTKENAIAYLTKKRDFLPSFIYGLERLTYNLI